MRNYIEIERNGSREDGDKEMVKGRWRSKNEDLQYI